MSRLRRWLQENSCSVDFKTLREETVRIYNLLKKIKRYSITGVIYVMTHWITVLFCFYYIYFKRILRLQDFVTFYVQNLNCFFYLILFCNNLQHYKQPNNTKCLFIQLNKVFCGLRGFCPEDQCCKQSALIKSVLMTAWHKKVDGNMCGLIITPQKPSLGTGGGASQKVKGNKWVGGVGVGNGRENGGKSVPNRTDRTDVGSWD